MDRYIDELTSYLHNLSMDERQNAVDFYREYLQDGGFKDYDAAVSELGLPKQLARKILADYSIKENESVTDNDKRVKKSKSDAKTIWLIVLALLSTPVTIPLAIALVLVGIGVIIAVVGIIFGLAMMLIGLVVMAFGSLFAGVTLLPASLWTGMYYLGIGLAVLGIFTVAVPIGKWFIDLVIHITSTISKWIYSKVVPKNRGRK